jgi:O-antigen/teichoic acid export membrane protein
MPMNSLLSGAALAVAMRWTDRLLGFASTLILARLLVPEDFGIIAMATVVIGLAGVLLDLGVHVALIQNKTPDRSHYDTAWTLGLIQAVVVMAMIMTAAPLAAAYFKEPRVAPVMMVLALSVPLAALENIGVVNFQKELRFAEDFRFVFLRRLIGFCTTIACALAFSSYWALVAGTLAGRAGGVLLSYALHPMRPRLSLDRFREIFGVSQWMLMRNITGYLDTRLPLLVVGGRVSSATTGVFSLADEIAALPTTELLAPLNRVLFPTFVQVKDDLPELARMFLLALGLQALVGIPAGLGLVMVAEPAVLVLLGAKWIAAAPFIQVLALGNLCAAIGVAGIYVMYALGRINITAWFALAQVLLFAAGAFLALPAAGPLAIAWLRVGVALAGIGVFLHLVMRVLPVLSTRSLVAAIIRPAAGAAVMVLVLHLAAQRLALPPAADLVVRVALGMLVYGLTVLAAWRWAGCPAGAERWLLDKLAPVLDKARRSRVRAP